MLAIATAVAVVQVGFLASMIVGRAAILQDGREVFLEVRPVDPRDLLRGDYVVLDYNISQVATELFVEAPSEEDRAGDASVYVRLKANADGLWQPIAARYGQAPEPAAAADEIDIRGKAGTWHGDAASVSIDYGVERFYVPEGEGLAIERDMNVRPFRMKLAIDVDGTAQIKSFHDGETMLYAEPLY
ncbi:GDYXXLXY domain-containing protein [Mesorhizobium sp. CAU 1741]|uniref:GDYXXLXY domain-containing protein n=1 Tax=Mesorhizobium sp. CAU 1741 TaxID=3140366 RepID=UPI00325B71FE